MKAQLKVGEIGWSAGCDDFYIAFFGVADPAGEAEFAGLTMNEPAKADTLHATLHEKMKNHSVVTMASVADGAARCNRGGSLAGEERLPYGAPDLFFVALTPH